MYVFEKVEEQPMWKEETTLTKAAQRMKCPGKLLFINLLNLTPIFNSG
jgi:hypothetical protein